MVTAAKTSAVTDALRFFIDLSCNSYDVDEQGYITAPNEEGVYRPMKRGEPPRKIMVFKEKISDTESLILNPFSEGIQETAAGKWFYRLMRASLVMRVSIIMETAIKVALHEKEEAAKPAAKRKKNAKRTPPLLVKLISHIINDVDEKMLDEMALLHKKSDDNVYLVNLFYTRKLLATRFDVPIVSEGENWHAPGTIRKGTINVFRKLLQEMFDLKDEDDLTRFTAKAHEDATPKIDSYMRCLYNVYKQINDLLNAVDPDLVVDLGSFKEHLDMMPQYTLNARSMVVTQPATKSSVPVQGVPTGNNIPSSSMGIPSNTGYVPDAGGANKIPGTVYTDGRQDPADYISSPSYGYQGPQMPMQPQMGMGYLQPGMSQGMMGIGAGPVPMMGMGYSQPPMNQGWQMPNHSYGFPMSPNLPTGIR